MRGHAKLIETYSSGQKILIFLLLAILAFQVFISISHSSITIDEVCYVGSGLMLAETGNFRSNALVYHPPLSYYLNSMFLLHMPVDEKIWQGNDCWETGKNFVFHSGYDPNTILFFSRLPFLILGLALGMLILHWSTRMYGPRSGIAALTLYCFWPPTVGYASLATTDFTVSAMIVFTLYFFWKWCHDPDLKRAGIVGLFLGLALCSKVTAVILLPALAFIVLALCFWKRTIAWKSALVHGIAILIVAFAVIFCLYGFQISTLSNAFPPEHYAQKARAELQVLPFGSHLVFIFDRVPIPAASYFAEFGNLLYISSQPKPIYILGEVTGTPPWYFGLLTLVIKVNTALIMLLAFLVILWRTCPLESTISKLCLYIPLALMLLNFALTTKASGIRHMLAIVFLAFIVLSKLFSAKPGNGGFNKSIKVILAILLAVYCIEGLAASPFYLSHANFLVGGSSGAHRVVVGSNIDLGQDLKELKQFMDEREIDSVALSYFGSIDPKEYGISYEYLPSPSFLPWVPDYSLLTLKEREEDCSSRSGIVVVSITNLKGVHLTNHSCYSWLWDKEPLDTLGHTLFVYSITP